MKFLCHVVFLRDKVTSSVWPLPLLLQPCEKPGRPWRTSVCPWLSSKRERGSSALTWAGSAAASTEPSATPTAMMKSQTPPQCSCAAASASHCRSCRSAPISHGYKTDCNALRCLFPLSNTPVLLTPGRILFDIYFEVTWDNTRECKKCIVCFSAAQCELSAWTDKWSGENRPQCCCPEGESWALWGNLLLKHFISRKQWYLKGKNILLLNETFRKIAKMYSFICD